MSTAQFETLSVRAPDGASCASTAAALEHGLHTQDAELDLARVLGDLTAHAGR